MEGTRSRAEAIPPEAGLPRTALPGDGPGSGSTDPPFVLPDTVELRQGIAFTEPGVDALHLDLFLPRQLPSGARGVIYIHGGGWRGGTRRQFWRQAAHLATLGCVGICSEYRLTPEHTYPKQLADAQAAVRWLRRHASELGVDPGRLGAVGGSAGGHLAALLGTTERVVDGVSSRVQAVVAFNGVFDLSSGLSAGAEGPVLALLGGDAGRARDASPFWCADATAAPTLLLHGDGDATVPYTQSVAFRDRLRALGVPVHLYTEPGAGHGFFNRPPAFQRPLPVLERFLLGTL
jgi:acetyl esterase/lipase